MGSDYPAAVLLTIIAYSMVPSLERAARSAAMPATMSGAMPALRCYNVRESMRWLPIYQELLLICSVACGKDVQSIVKACTAGPVTEQRRSVAMLATLSPAMPCDAI